MKQKKFFLGIILAFCTFIGGYAQSDVTNLVLKNASFDEGINFTKDGEVVHWRTSANDDAVNWGMHSLEGWEPYITENPTGCGATFEFGTESMINSVTPPPTAYDGTTNGGALGFSAGWGTEVGYTQNVILPAGSYTITYVFYNMNASADGGTSLAGWIPDEGDAALSSVASFLQGSWESDEISFELAANTAGKIRVGLASIAGSGSGAVAKLFIDYIKLTCNYIDKTQLSALITEGETLYGNGSGTKAPELLTALNAVKAVLSQEATSATLINAAVSLGYAVSQYKIQAEKEEAFAQSKAELEELLDQADELTLNHNSNVYSQAAYLALENILTDAWNAYDDDELTFDNIADYVSRLRLAIENYLASASGLKINYTFDNVTGNTVANAAGEEYSGTLYNEASVIPMGKYKVLSLGNGTGYLDMSTKAGNIVSSMENYTVSVYYRVDKNASLSGNGYFLWAFSELAVNSATAGPYLAYRLNAQLFSLSTGGWNNGNEIAVDEAATKDVWQHVLYRQTGNIGELYIDGQLIGTNDAVPIPSATFTTPPLYNWIGRAPFNGDNYLKNTLVYDFRFYNQAVDDDQITEWAALVSDLENEYNYGTKGDFSQLIALIAEYRAVLASITVGENPGQYPQAAVWEMEDALSPAEALVTENKASQFVIDAQIVDLKTAYTTLLAAIIPESNTIATGEYYINLNGLYINNPGKSVLANGVDLSVANSGLQSARNILDESQIYNVSKEAVDAADPEIFRYSISSTVNEADSIDDPYPYRCMTDWTRYEKLALNLNWWTFDISYNPTVEAYSIYCGGDGTARGYWRYIEADQRLTNQNGVTAVPSYIFNFISVKTVFDEEVANGRAVLNEAVVGTADDEYSQSVYDAFSAAQATAEAVTDEEFTKEDLFEYAAARKLFVRNDGSSAFSAIVKVQPARSEVSISGGDKQIHIVTGKSARLAVYTLTGAMVAQRLLSSGETIVPVNPGLYIVKVSGQTTTANKVIVR
ncbi:MAG: DUF6383 domain-containing protein [Bacteroidales bacterium]|jgi:hypothetical protein|nr:DUF6383 domain-containing protein [Bacteroidales bacterium]